MSIDGNGDKVKTNNIVATAIAHRTWERVEHAKGLIATQILLNGGDASEDEIRDLAEWYLVQYDLEPITADLVEALALDLSR